jgi:hypothetical protein
MPRGVKKVVPVEPVATPTAVPLNHEERLILAQFAAAAMGSFKIDPNTVRAPDSYYAREAHKIALEMFKQWKGTDHV